MSGLRRQGADRSGWLIAAAALAWLCAGVAQRAEALDDDFDWDAEFGGSTESAENDATGADDDGSAEDDAAMGDEPEGDDAGSALDDGADEEPDETEGDAGEAGDAGDAAGPFEAWLQVGVGVTQRTIEYESTEGPEQLDTQMVPAADVALRGGTTADDGLWLWLALRYQTSLFSDGVQQTPLGEDRQTTIRSHRFEGGLEAGLYFGEAHSSVSLGALVGYGLRALDTVEDLRIPRFTLHGPLLRLAVRVPIADLIVLRLAPEAQLIVGITPELREDGNLEGLGVALGGEASLRANWLDWLATAVSFRQSNASVASIGPTSLSDVERFLLLELLLRFH